MNSGGAERVLLAISEIYPNAPIYTIYAKKDSPAVKQMGNVTIKESWFSYLPFAHKIISPLRFLIPLIWSSFNFKSYDLVITSASWAVTKGMRGAKREICYLHSPPRYLYGYDTSRNWQGKWFSGAIKAYALVVNHFMRIYDFKQAQKVSYFIANSQNVAKRIEKFYRRTDYKVIYPPVDVSKFKHKPIISHKSDYYLTGGRMTAAKNFDLIIKACKKIRVNLKIFGTGVEEKNLKKLSKKHPPADSKVEFLGNISDSDLINYYKNARAFIVAQKDEDFGITPIEAAAACCPTIAYRGGGYLESVIENKTGIFFDELTVDSLVKAIERLNRTTIKPSVLVSHARKFSKERFQKEFIKFINSNA